jgi:hypothetical protein
MSSLPNCADNGTNVAAKTRVTFVCPVLINETDDPGVKEAVGFR